MGEPVAYDDLLEVDGVRTGAVIVLQDEVGQTGKNDARVAVASEVEWAGPVLGESLQPAEDELEATQRGLRIVVQSRVLVLGVG